MSHLSEFAEQVLVYGLYSSALFLDVFPHIINITVKSRKSIQEEIRLACIFRYVRIYNDFYSFFFYVYVNVASCHYRVSVVMYGSGFAPVNMYPFCPESLYLGVFVERFVEQVKAYLRCVEHIEWFHYYNVHQSVCHCRFRSYLRMR